MRTSYREEDVVLLLKDITGRIQPMSAQERERKIQAGIHYSELLPMEYKPTNEYFALYQEALKKNAAETAQASVTLAEQIFEEKEQKVVLVSLARAGTPIGILLKRYLEKTYHLTVPHYGISIIRGRGIDKNAMEYILQRYQGRSIQFVDGWIGKGAIIRQLREAVKEYPDVSGELAVLSDPAEITSLCGTRKDFLLPSACLNAPVSGLFSRTVLNDLIGPEDFHGAVYYEEMEKIDCSYAFIEAVEKKMEGLTPKKPPAFTQAGAGLSEVEEIAREFHIGDINRIKPGIGETTRVLLRRVPWKVLMRPDSTPDDVEHILRLCKEKNVEVVEYPLKHYQACGIIRDIADV